MSPMKRLLYLIYFWLIAMPVFVVCTIILALITYLGCPLSKSNWFCFYPGMIWSRIALWLSLCPIKVEGWENLDAKAGPYVVVANHQGAFDIFMMYGYLGIPFKWVLKEGIRKIPFVGAACRAAGFIFVDDTKPSSIGKTMKSAHEVLASNTSIFIFPEGSRSSDGQMARFKKGGFIMASELGVPIVPIAIDGSFDVLKRGSLTVTPRRLRMTILPTMHIEDFGEPPMNIQLAAREAQRRIAFAIPSERKFKEA
ncbi:lysophospholipid acyltransferase family protein [Porphyromonas macacae]|uniref:lysophospholipid acyltransferase family protein n=1 Tax=Porphyromonas macacae TaxID=28115 RepID=UPI0024AE31C1|nr:lysophospholipid acyltransferase family protein [Porphyromonas macacae]